LAPDKTHLEYNELIKRETAYDSINQASKITEKSNQYFEEKLAETKAFRDNLLSLYGEKELYEIDRLYHHGLTVQAVKLMEEWMNEKENTLSVIDEMRKEFKSLWDKYPGNETEHLERLNEAKSKNLVSLSQKEMIELFSAMMLLGVSIPAIVLALSISKIKESQVIYRANDSQTEQDGTVRNIMQMT